MSSEFSLGSHFAVENPPNEKCDVKASELNHSCDEECMFFDVFETGLKADSLDSSYGYGCISAPFLPPHPPPPATTSVVKVYLVE